MANNEFDDLKDTFDFLDDWEDRYRHIIELGRTLAPLSQDEHSDAYKVRGCQSQVWLVPDIMENGRIIFRGDSDAHIVRGLIAVLLSLYSDKTADDILAIDARGELEGLGLSQHLSPMRANGLFAMVQRIRNTAEAEQNKSV